MDTKFFVLFGAFLFVAGCQGSGGSGPAQVDPTAVEPKFESIREIDPNLTYQMYQHCSNQYQIDPRLKAGQVFTQISSGYSQKHQAPYRTIEENHITSVTPGNLVVDSTLSSGGVKLQSQTSYSCEKQSNGWNCGTPKTNLINVMPKVPVNSESSPETCETKWSWASDEPGSTQEAQLGYVTLATGEKALAVRSVESHPTQTECSTPRKAVTQSVSITTLSLPAPWASNTHCFATVYSNEGFYEVGTHKMIREDKTALIGHPRLSELETYPGFENVEAFFPEKEVTPAQPEPNEKN